MAKDREQAWNLLTEYTTKDALIKHALAVEAAMRDYAERLGEDAESWGIVGLIHDFDYERYPGLEQHPFKGAEILEEQGYPREWITAILGHGNHTGVARETAMAKALFAVDELTGFIVAVTLVRPSKKIADVKTSSVKKKMKDKGFAAAVSRDDIRQGAEELGVPLDDHITNVVSSMKRISEDLGQYQRTSVCSTLSVKIPLSLDT
jgi:putative nucleotidyltransferase with HDIG domain